MICSLLSLIDIELNCLSSGTIRGDFALAVGRNICHGSDAVESAENEIAL